jgi:hypothetical protein
MNVKYIRTFLKEHIMSLFNGLLKGFQNDIFMVFLNNNIM